MAKQQKETKGHDYSVMLIWGAAIVGTIRYSAAFLASDMGEITGGLSLFVSILLGLSGIGMGVLDTLGGAYLFDGWRRAMPRNGQAWPFRFKALTLFVIAIFVVGLGILVPFTVSRVAHATMEHTLGDIGIWLWGAAVNLAPILLIAGVALGNNIVKVTESGGQMSGQMSEMGGQMSGQNAVTYPTDWRKVKKLLTREQIVELATMRTEAICYKYGIEDRQARRWREGAQKEVAKVPA